MKRYDLKSSSILKREVHATNWNEHHVEQERQFGAADITEEKFGCQSGSSVFYLAGNAPRCVLLLDIEHVLTRDDANDSAVLFDEQGR